MFPPSEHLKTACGCEKRVRKEIHGGRKLLKKDREGKRVLTFEGKVDNRQPRQFLLRKVIGDRKAFKSRRFISPGGSPAALTDVSL